LNDLQQAGATLCLDGHVPVQNLPQSVSFRFVIADLADARCAAPPGLMLARDLADVDAFDTALKNGFDGAIGWFFLRTKPIAKKLAPSHAQIVRLLNLVRRNAEVRDIEAALKQDVALSLKLLRYINSAGFGLSCEIQSFRHAVTILGYDKLHKWLSLLLVTASKYPIGPALMQTSIVRGRFMEIMGAQFVDKREVDNLFITGAFSLLDILLGTSMEAILDEMKLPQVVTDTLLHRDSVYKPFLELAVASESDSDTSLAEMSSSLQLEAARVNRAQLQALSFADSLPFG
jgi:EAL and modified HD-GYP domain-containing signal transduction protein